MGRIIPAKLHDLKRVEAIFSCHVMGCMTGKTVLRVYLANIFGTDGFLGLGLLVVQSVENREKMNLIWRSEKLPL